MKIYLSVPDFKECFEDAFDQKIPVIFEDISLSDLDKKGLVIFPGGEDVSPRLYNEPPIYSFGYSLWRDDIERKIYRACVLQQIKMLGVCRGHQLLNVLRGGSLYQDLLMEEKEHTAYHTLDFLKKKSIFSCFTEVNSVHHQGIRQFSGRSYEIIASHKGIIEAVENSNFISCQFHPEFNFSNECDEFFKRVKVWVKGETND